MCVFFFWQEGAYSIDQPKTRRAGAEVHGLTATLSTIDDVDDERARLELHALGTQLVLQRGSGNATANAFAPPKV